MRSALRRDCPKSRTRQTTAAARTVSTYSDGITSRPSTSSIPTRGHDAIIKARDLAVPESLGLDYACSDNYCRIEHNRHCLLGRQRSSGNRSFEQLRSAKFKSYTGTRKIPEQSAQSRVTLSYNRLSKPIPPAAAQQRFFDQVWDFPNIFVHGRWLGEALSAMRGRRGQ
jgi:hypothetical protein